MATAHSTTARNLCVAVTYTDVRGVKKRVHGQQPIKGCAVWQVPIKMWEWVTATKRVHAMISAEPGLTF